MPVHDKQSAADRETLRAAARRAARGYAEDIRLHREVIVASADTLDLFFADDMDEDEKAVMRRWLVKTGRAQWAIPRTELL